MKNSDFKVFFENDFKRKILELVFYITYKLGNPNAGIKLKTKLINAAKALNVFPERQPVMQVEKPSGIVVRKLIVDKYIITYFIDYKNKIVHINNLITSK